nr:hypothetical protein CFP56_13753 [Quercus suber]
MPRFEVFAGIQKPLRTRSYVKVIKRYSLQLKRLFVVRFWKLKQVQLLRNNDSFEMDLKISPKINKGVLEILCGGNDESLYFGAAFWGIYLVGL